MDAPTTRAERFALLRDAALARPFAGGWIAGALQLWLIVLSHGITLVVTVIAFDAVWETAFSFWNAYGLSHGAIAAVGNPLSPPGALGGVLLVSLIVAVAQGALAWLPFRYPTRREQVPLALFIRSWWRSCAWGALIIPTAGVVFAQLPAYPLDAYVPGCVLVAYLLFGPTAFAWEESRPRRPRLSRWCPVCPECSYSLRKLRGERCPECGVTFPTTQRVFRRWAVRRLIWERVQRGNFAVAYIKTLLVILFRPFRAARGVAVPDRMGKAVRWAATHTILLAIAAVGVGATPRGLRILFAPTGWWSWAPGQAPTFVTLLGWACQSLATWLIAIGALPLLAVCLSAAAPVQHPAARRGMIKWSLYSTAVVVLVLAACYAHSIWTWLLFEWLGPRPGNMWLFYGPRPLPTVFFASVYGLWWAAGVSANPYLRRRGLRVFVLCFAVFILSWLALTAFVLPPGALAELL
jgi:hypothetical protein